MLLKSTILHMNIFHFYTEQSATAMLQVLQFLLRSLVIVERMSAHSLLNEKYNKMYYRNTVEPLYTGHAL